MKANSAERLLTVAVAVLGRYRLQAGARPNRQGRVASPRRRRRRVVVVVLVVVVVVVVVV